MSEQARRKSEAQTDADAPQPATNEVPADVDASVEVQTASDRVRYPWESHESQSTVADKPAKKHR